MRVPIGYSNRTQLNVSIAREELDQIKQIALWQQTPVSRLFSSWIRAKYAETKRGQSTQAEG